MITLAALAALAERHRDDLGRPVAPVMVGDRLVDTDATPVVMGTINLSRDSTYRESIATTTDSAIRRGRILFAEGADVVDVGAVSTNAGTDRPSAARQVDLLVPVVEGLVDAGVVVSAETADPVVAKACLSAGARVLNFVGHAHDLEMFDLVAASGATLVLCSVAGDDVHDLADVDLSGDPLPGYVDALAARLAEARRRGVEHVVVDPGLGFFYGNLTDPATRVGYQTRVLLQSFRLRRLGVPICHALPHAFDLFQEQYRSAEPMFAVLARLGGAGWFRTHEVAPVRATLDALQHLPPD